MRRDLLPLILGFLIGGCDQNQQVTSPSPSSSRGAVLFQTYCAACHQPDGKGTPGRIPPLAGSPWVSGSEDRIIRIVLHGLRGPIEVNGATFEVEMLGFGPVLSDEEVADVLTEVRSRFGNVDKPILPEKVTRVRQATKDRIGYWTVAELLEVP